jgi:tetratricopeptide (TPR) repeat protein
MNFDKAVQQAQALLAGGQLAEAEKIYQGLADQKIYREAALVALADFYLHARQPAKAANALLSLVTENPDSLQYCDRLATLFSKLGQMDASISVYERLIDRQPRLAEAHYNVALLYKQQKRFDQAITAYKNAVKLGISRVHEVYVNLGVLCSELRRPDEARSYFERALELDPGHVPALFNLATHYEETGDREHATSLYRQILDLDPRHWDSLSRLAYADRLPGKDDPLIASLRDAVKLDIGDRTAHESLYYALGKALDDVGEYEDAFAAYEAANEIGKSRMPPYDPVVAEDAIDELIEWCDQDWISNVSTSLPEAPIFICGMFRSGSTLIEQILGAHELITAGGELDILPWLLTRDMSPYPERLRMASPAEIEALAREYLTKQAEIFPEAKHVTDKRPDNHMHLGLIKALFPAVKIVYTTRAPLDNCLSVYFQQLGGNLTYSNDLEHIAHYYKQQQRLLEHWQACFGDNIMTVSYDEVVRSPEPKLREVLDFLGFEWDERVLRFQQSGNQVKTASVWQVREGLHVGSSGRWRNYETALEAIKDSF